MTFFSNLNNLNTSYFSQGLNSGSSWFMPSFGVFGGGMWSGFGGGTPFSWNMPSLFNWNSFSMPAFNWDFNSVMTMLTSKPAVSSWNFSPQNYSPSTTFDNYSFSNIWDRSVKQSSSASSVGDSFTISNKNKTKLSDVNYDSKAGEKLAKTALQNSSYVIDKNSKTKTSKRKNPDKFTSSCAMYVKASIRDAGLGSYKNGHAYQMTGILRSNPNFKEISASSVNVKDLPSGCILVYNRGTAGYSSEYGHTEITTGDGRAVSDGITDHLYKKPSAIFVPVTSQA